VLKTDRNWQLAAGALLLFSTACALFQLDRYPLESHEIFVAQTAREMAARGDWLVPRFNGEPRLTKPPLSYWLTGLFAWLDGKPVNALHARLPSALAGVGLVALTLLLGRRLLGHRGALLAGLILTASTGFLQYTHNARPEMLYAFCCGIGITALTADWQAEGAPWRRRLLAHLAWFGFALATLTKGPHLPAMLLVGFAGFLARERVGWRRAWAILQPLTGLLLLALTLPWWWLLRQQLGDQSLATSQLTGKLLRPDWVQLLNPYYLYRGLQLALPWLALFPLLLVFTRRSRAGDTRLRLLLWLILVPMLLLSLGSQRRWYYMLPALMPFCLLLAAALERLYTDLAQGARLRRWLAVAVPAQWAVILPLLLGFALWADPGRYPELRTALLWALPASAVPGVLYWRFARNASGPLPPVLASTCLFIVTAGFVHAGGHGLLDRKKQECLQVVRFLDTGAVSQLPLATLDTPDEPYIFYAQRHVQALHDLDDLRTAIAETGAAALVVILPRSTLNGLPPDLSPRVLYPGAAEAADPLLVVGFGNL